MSELTSIARPYAKAVFDFAVEQSAADKSAVGKWTEMLNFAANAVQDKTVQTLLNGSLSTQKAADLMLAVCGENLDRFGQNLIRLMAENKRLAALPDVFSLFRDYVAEHEATAEVDVISAQPLDKAQRQKITVAMEKRLARKVKLNCSIDRSLIAGAVIRTADFVIDGSSRGQLNRLADELQ